MGATKECETLEQANKFCKDIKPGCQKEKEDSFKNEESTEYIISTTKKGKKKFTYDEFMSESSTWNTTSLLNMKDLMAGKVSKVIKPVYKGNEVVWLVRWAVNVAKTDRVILPDVSEDDLATAIRNKTCRIEAPTDNQPQFRVVMNA
jgi:hypothetical protein